MNVYLWEIPGGVVKKLLAGMRVVGKKPFTHRGLRERQSQGTARPQSGNTKPAKTLTSLVFAGTVITVVLSATTHFTRGKNQDALQRWTVKILRQKSLRSLKPASKEIQDSSTAVERRVLQVEIPKHVPIKVNIKKEKESEFEDFANKHWLRAFELEVKNTGTKPIYFIELVLDFPETRGPDGNQIAYSLMYGRGELISIMEPLKATDIPLNAGETHVFKLAERYLKGWDNLVQQDHIPQPKKVSVVFQFINFGDGSGFRGSTGQPVTKIQSDWSCHEVDSWYAGCW